MLTEKVFQYKITIFPNTKNEENTLYSGFAYLFNIWPVSRKQLDSHIYFFIQYFAISYFIWWVGGNLALLRYVVGKGKSIRIAVSR